MLRGTRLLSSIGNRDTGSIVKGFFEKNTNTAQYIVSCTKTNEAVVIDPVLEYDLSSGTTGTESADILLEHIKQKRLNVKYLLETHVHADHITSACYLKQELSRLQDTPEICISKNVTIVQKEFSKLYQLDVPCDGSQFDRLLCDGDKLSVGNVLFTVMDTPGHTPACVSYLVDNQCIFVGDTLFMPDSGTARCDFPGGSADTMWNSLQKILSLDPSTIVYVCHDYLAGGKRETFHYESNIAEQRKNIQLDGVDASGYKNFRKTRDSTLGLPKLIHPSLQFNLSAGTPPATSFIKMPITAAWYKGTNKQ